MKKFIEKILNKNFFIITPRTQSYGGIADSLMHGYKLSKHFKKKILLAVPFFNLHGYHKKKKIFGIKLILILFFKDLSFDSKIISILITILINFNMLLKKIKFLGFLNILIKNNDLIENIFPTKLGFIGFNGSEISLDQEIWKSVFEIRNFEYFRNFSSENFIAFYVKDDNYNKISPISSLSTAEIENYRSTIKYLIQNGYCIKRVGDQLSKKFKFEDDKYFDLTRTKKNFKNKQYSAFSKCLFYFGCGSSPSSYASFFNKSRVLTNLDINNLLNPSDFFFRSDLLLFKKIYFKPSRKIISLEELLNLDYDNLMNKENFLLIENNPKEIEDTIKEFKINFNLKNVNFKKKQIEFNHMVKNFFHKHENKNKMYNIFYYSNFIIPNFYLEKYLYKNSILDEENSRFNYEN